jgi:hypothetical protein
LSIQELKYRLEGFQVYGFGLSNRACPDFWCHIYNDTGQGKYNDDVIEVKVDSVKPFSEVVINLLKRRSPQDNDFVYLALCEVKIYAGI